MKGHSICGGSAQMLVRGPGLYFMNCFFGEMTNWCCLWGLKFGVHDGWNIWCSCRARSVFIGSPSKLLVCNASTLCLGGKDRLLGVLMKHEESEEWSSLLLTSLLLLRVMSSFQLKLLLSKYCSRQKWCWNCITLVQQELWLSQGQRTKFKKTQGELAYDHHNKECNF